MVKIEMLSMLVAKFIVMGPVSSEDNDVCMCRRGIKKKCLYYKIFDLFDVI